MGLARPFSGRPVVRPPLNPTLMRQRHHAERRRLTRQRILLAVYLLADPQGLCCLATNAALARAAGRGIDAVKAYLRELERDGAIVVLGAWEGLPCRVIVLSDHPGATRFVRALRRPRADRSRPARRA